MNVKTRRIAILVIILGTNSLDEIFVYQVTLSMLLPLGYHQLHLVRLKKSSGKDWRQPNKGIIKYGIIVPRNVKEATHVDKENSNSLWANAILK